MLVLLILYCCGWHEMWWTGTNSEVHTVETKKTVEHRFWLCEQTFKYGVL